MVQANACDGLSTGAERYHLYLSHLGRRGSSLAGVQPVVDHCERQTGRIAFAIALQIHRGIANEGLPLMSVMGTILMHAFGRPRGVLENLVVSSWRARMLTSAPGPATFLTSRQTTACWKSVSDPG